VMILMSNLQVKLWSSVFCFHKSNVILLFGVLQFSVVILFPFWWGTGGVRSLIHPFLSFIQLDYAGVIIFGICFASKWMLENLFAPQSAMMCMIPTYWLVWVTKLLEILGYYEL
jgi:hypothetical protein